MLEFRLYICVNRFGKMTVRQREQLNLLVGLLTGRRINTYWLIDDKYIKGSKIINILSEIHSVCKKKEVNVHIELCSTNKKITLFSRIILKHTPVTLYSNERDDEKDYMCLKFLNHPDGCMYNSCLGNTLYLKQNADFSICPRLENISLNPLRDGASINSVFDTEDFRKLLCRQIAKRNYCKENCHLFTLCHGGCPVQESSGECSIQSKIKGLSITEERKQEQTIKKLANLYRG